MGRNPKVDEMAGALSLYLSLKQENKKVTIASPTDPIVEVSNLVGIDKVKKGFDSDQGDLTVSFPYKEGEIEKISYTLEDGKLNILVKAGEQGLSFDERNVEFSRGGGAPKLVFIVGTSTLSELGRVFSAEALKNSTVVNIDYKENNQGFGDVVLVSKNLSSVSELVASLLDSLGFRIDEDIASNLLSGITDATDNFQSPKTSPLSFEMAGLLMKKGAVRDTGRSKKSEDAYSFFTPTKHPKRTIEPKSAVAKGTSEPSKDKKLDEENPPDDWLAPKIYKGSTSI